MLESDDAGLGPERAGSALRPSDRRDAVRHTLLIRSAKLIVQGAEFLCILCDASETGAKVRLFHDLPDTRTMILELQNENRFEAELVWRKGDKAGFRFLELAHMDRILEVRDRFEKRPVRVRLQVPCLLIAGDAIMDTVMVDVSQQGAKLVCAHPIAVRQSVRLKAKGLPAELPAKVCWRRGDQVGLAFETAQIVHTLQSRGSAGGLLLSAS
jgi:hypothetical protein